ncbi:MAG TPA: alpha/beta fold hydrolase [Thermoanaerobaculia bacterium]|nr:alpha/beta fold hydrolase [Thermoanaerobaculia bacterium]
MSAFVLVHGAWHGAWCWQAVADLLRTQGHQVFTPTLAGLGERSHLLSFNITLETHIADIVDVFTTEQLDDVILCAHSYGPWPTSGALEHIHRQVGALVFLDAHLPQDGQCGIDTSNHPEKVKEALATGQPGTEHPHASEFASAENSAWVNELLTKQPVGVALQPIRLTGCREAIKKKLYIRTTKYASDRFDQCREDARATGWQVLETPSTHDMMIDEPELLAHILAKFATTPVQPDFREVGQFSDS